MYPAVSTASAASVVCTSGGPGVGGDVAHGEAARVADTFCCVARRTHRKETPMSKLASLDDLLVHELQDIYHAEGQILTALPKMVNAATHPDLKDAFVEHLQQTEGQVRRLEQAFKLLGVPAKGKKCEGMAGLLEEGRKVMEEDAELPVRDAALIAAAQKVEHYEIASYGCVCTYAEMLGYDQVHDLLGQNLEEEELTDEKLTALAESVINLDAEEAESEDAEEEASR